MKKWYFLLCLLYALIGHTQQIPFKVLKSEIFTDEFRRSDIALAEDDGHGGLFVVRSYDGGGFSFNRGYYIEKYDSDLKLLKTKDYDMTYDTSKKYSTVLGMFNDGETLHIVELHFDIKIDAYVCTAHNIDINDFESQKQELFKLTVPEMKQYGYLILRELFFDRSYNIMQSNHPSGSFIYAKGPSDLFTWKTAMEQSNNGNGISIAVNADKSAFAIALDLSSKKSETLKIFLFDKKCRTISQQYFQPGLKDKKFVYQSLTVAQDGKTAYLLGKAYTKASKDKTEGGKYEYQLTAFNAEGQQTQNFGTDDHFVNSLKMLFLGDRMACIGFYSDESENRYKGISFFDLDPLSLTVRNATYSPFPAQFLIDKYGEEKLKELKFLTFRSFQQTKTGDVIFNAEEFYTTTSQNSAGPVGMGSTSSQTSYHYDDIVCARLNANGALIWARNVNKRQATTGSDSDYLSYSSMVNDDNTYFFINAAEKVRKISNDRIEFKGARKSKSNLNLIQINKEGVFDYQEVLDNEANEVPFMVGRGVQNGTAEYFLGRKGKNKQLLKITL